MKGTGHDLIR